MAEIYDYDVVPANNNSAPPDGWPEGMSYQQVNDAARDMQAAIAKFISATGVTASTGSGSDFAITVPQNLTAYEAGMRFSFLANHTVPDNLDGVTLNVNGIEAVAVLDNEGNDLTIAEAIVENQLVEVTHNGTNFIMTSPVGGAIGDENFLRLDGTNSPTANIDFPDGIGVQDDVVIDGRLHVRGTG